MSNSTIADRTLYERSAIAVVRRDQVAAEAGFVSLAGFAAVSAGLVSVFAAGVSAGLASAFAGSPFSAAPLSARLRFLSPSFLKSVSYQPVPAKRNDGA